MLKGNSKLKKNGLGISTILVVALILTACGGGGNNKVADGAKNMQDVLVSVKAAVDAGDAAKAKSEGPKLEEAWAKFEDNVKEKSKENYDKAETQLHIIQAGVGMEPLDKEILNKAIDELDKVLGDIGK
jgi:hypothetical protein